MLWLEWVSEFIGLGEEITAAMLVDKDKFNPILIFLVFAFEPMAKILLRYLTKHTKTLWDDYIFKIVSEGVQCFLFIYFTGYDDNAKIIFPSIMALQILLHTWNFYVESKKKEASDDTFERFKCFCSLFDHVTGSVHSLLFLLCNENAPFRTKSFEIALTVFLWLLAMSSASPFKHITFECSCDTGEEEEEEANKKDEPDAEGGEAQENVSAASSSGFKRSNLDDLDDLIRNANAPLALKRSKFDVLIRNIAPLALNPSKLDVLIRNIAPLAYAIYVYCLSILYLHSGDAKEVGGFDFWYTILAIVFNTLIIFCYQIPGTIKALKAMYVCNMFRDN